MSAGGRGLKKGGNEGGLKIRLGGRSEIARVQFEPSHSGLHGGALYIEIHSLEPMLEPLLRFSTFYHQLHIFALQKARVQGCRMLTQRWRTLKTRAASNPDTADPAVVSDCMWR